jgi:predicted RNA-binding Zn ribbon-like protein
VGTASRQPVNDRHDASFIPVSNWPADREGAPGSLEVLRRFCNTVNDENNTDRLGSARELDEWLGEIGRDPMRLRRSDVDRLRRLRDGIRALLRRPSDHRTLLHAASDLVLTIGVDDDGVLVLRGRSRVDVLRAEIVGIVFASQHDGTWRRLKRCGNCGWAFYDHSKNASGRWCTMQACGQRIKAKAYRSRRRQQPTG